MKPNFSQIFCKKTLVLFLICGTFFGSVSQAALQTITFKVPVSLSNVAPTVKSASVFCFIINPLTGTTAIGSQGAMSAWKSVSISGGVYQGTVSVPVNVDTAAMKPQSPWLCNLFLNLFLDYTAGSSKMPSPTATEYYLKPKAGASFLASTKGNLP